VGRLITTLARVSRKLDYARRLIRVLLGFSTQFEHATNAIFPPFVVRHVV
jgi:hypothetical protein